MQISTVSIPVRYAETDQMGVVHHANYLVWMEIGRTNLIKDLGFSYAQLEKEGILAPVIDVQVSYKKPCKYGETVQIQTWIEDYNGLKVVYGYKIFKESGELVVTGTTTHVCVKKENFKPGSIRTTHPEWHEAYLKAKKK